jgi:hypothetical protein
MIYMGIDPGASGGVAVIADINGGLEVAAHEMPEQVNDLMDLLASYGNTSYAVCERVGPNRGKGERRQGASSMFTFGRGFGRLETALVASGIRHEFYGPQIWQKVFGLSGVKDETSTEKKNRHKAAAVRLFPGVKVTHKVADAILIAEFARRTWTAHIRSR